MNSSSADKICPSLPPELSTDTCTFSGSCFGRPSLLIQDHSPTSPAWCVTPNSTGGPVVLYTDIPYVSKIVRVVGHVAVTNYARTKIYELRAWPYISTNNGVWILEGMKDITKPILFGKPRKYLPIAVPPGAERLWDEALEEEAVRWHRKIHLGVSSNCHTFVSDVLNNLHNRLGGKGKPHSFLSLMWDVCHRGVPILSDSVRHSGWKWVFSDHRKLWLSVLETCIGLHRPIDPKCRRQLNRSTTQYVFPLLSRVVKPIAELLYGDLRSPSEKRDAERRVGLWQGYATGEDCGVALKGQGGRERRVRMWRAAEGERRVGMSVGGGQVTERDAERRLCEWKRYDSDDNLSEDSFYNSNSTDYSDDDKLIEMHGVDTDGNSTSGDVDEDTCSDTSTRIADRNYISARPPSTRSITAAPQTSHRILQTTSSSASWSSSSRARTAEPGCAGSSISVIPQHHTPHAHYCHHTRHTHACHNGHQLHHHHHFCRHSYHHYQHHHSAGDSPSPRHPSLYMHTSAPHNDTTSSAPGASHSRCFPPCGTPIHTTAAVPLLRKTPRSPLPDTVPNSHNTHMSTVLQAHITPHPRGSASLLHKGSNVARCVQHSADTVHTVFARGKRLLAASPPPKRGTCHQAHAPIATSTHTHTCATASCTKIRPEDRCSAPGVTGSPLHTGAGAGASTSMCPGTNTRPVLTSPIAHLPHSPYVPNTLHQSQHARTPPLRHHDQSPSTLSSAHTHARPAQVGTSSAHTHNLAPPSPRAHVSMRTYSPQPQHQRHHQSQREPRSPPHHRSDTTPNPLSHSPAPGQPQRADVSPPSPHATSSIMPKLASTKASEFTFASPVLSSTSPPASALSAALPVPPPTSATASVHGSLPSAAASAPIIAEASRVDHSRTTAHAYTSDNTSDNTLHAPRAAGEDTANVHNNAVEATTSPQDSAPPVTALVIDPDTPMAADAATVESVTVCTPPQRLPASLSLQLPQTLPHRLRRANTCKAVSTLADKLSSLARTKLPATPSSLLQPRRPLLVYYSAPHRYPSKSPTIVTPHRARQRSTPKASPHSTSLIPTHQDTAVHSQGDTYVDQMAMAAVDVPDSSSLYAELRDLYPSAFSGRPGRPNDSALRQEDTKSVRKEVEVEEVEGSSENKSVMKRMQHGLESTAAANDIGVKDAPKPNSGTGVSAIGSTGTGTSKGMGAATSVDVGVREGSDSCAQRPAIPYSCRPAELGYWRSEKRHALNNKGIGETGEHSDDSPVSENSARKFRILPQSCPNMLSKSAHILSAKTQMGSKTRDAASATDGAGEGKGVSAREEEERKGEGKEYGKEEIGYEAACGAGQQMITKDTIPAITIVSHKDNYPSTLNTNTSPEVTLPTYGSIASATRDEGSSNSSQLHAAQDYRPQARGVRRSIAEGFYSHIYAAHTATEAAADEAARMATRLQAASCAADLHHTTTDRDLYSPDAASRCGEDLEYNKCGVPARGMRRSEVGNSQDDLTSARYKPHMAGAPCGDTTSQARPFVFTANSRNLHSPQRRSGAFPTVEAALCSGHASVPSTKPHTVVPQSRSWSCEGDNSCCERRARGIRVTSDCLETERLLSVFDCGVPVAACTSQPQCNGRTCTCQGDVAYTHPYTLRQCGCGDTACIQREQRYRRNKELCSEDVLPHNFRIQGNRSPSGATALPAAVTNTACGNTMYHQDVDKCMSGPAIAHQRRLAHGSKGPRRACVRSDKTCSQANFPSFGAATANAATSAAEAAARCIARDSSRNSVTDTTAHTPRYDADSLRVDVASANGTAEGRDHVLPRGISTTETASVLDSRVVPPLPALRIAEMDNDEHDEFFPARSSRENDAGWCLYGPKSGMNRILALDIGDHESGASSATFNVDGTATCGNVDADDVWRAADTIDAISHVDSVDTVSPQDYRLASLVHTAPKQVRVARNHFPSATHTNTNAIKLPADATGTATLPAAAALPKSSSKDTRSYIDPATLSSSALYVSLASQRTYPAFTAHHSTHAPTPVDSIRGHFGLQQDIFNSHHGHIGIHGPLDSGAVLSPAEEAYYIPTHTQRRHYEQRRSRSPQSLLTDAASAKCEVYASNHAPPSPLPVPLGIRATPAPPVRVCNSRALSACICQLYSGHCDVCGKSSRAALTAATIQHSCASRGIVYSSCAYHAGTRTGASNPGCACSAMGNAGTATIDSSARSSIDRVAAAKEASVIGMHCPQAIAACSNAAADLAATYSQSSWLRSNISSLYDFTATRGAMYTTAQCAMHSCYVMCPPSHHVHAHNSTSHATLRIQATHDPHTCCSTVNHAPPHVHLRAPTCPQPSPNPQTTTTDAPAHTTTEAGLAATMCSRAAVPPSASALAQCCCWQLYPSACRSADATIAAATDVRVHAPIATPATPAPLDPASASTSTSISVAALSTAINPANTANVAPNALAVPQAATIAPTVSYRARLIRSRSTPNFSWPMRSTIYNSKRDKPNEREQHATQDVRAQQKERAARHADATEASLVEHTRSDGTRRADAAASNGKNDKTYADAYNHESNSIVPPKTPLPSSPVDTACLNTSLTAGSRPSLDTSLPLCAGVSATRRDCVPLSCCTCHLCSCATSRREADLQSNNRAHGQLSCAHARVCGTHMDLHRTGSMLYDSGIEDYCRVGKESRNLQFCEKEIVSENSSLPEIRPLPAGDRVAPKNGDSIAANERSTPQPSMFTRDGNGKRTYPCVIVEDSPRDANRDKCINNQNYYANQAGGRSQYSSVYNPYAEDAPYSPNSFYERERTRFVNEAPLTPPSIPVLIHNAVGALTEKAVRVTAHSVAHLLRRMYGVYREIVSEPVRATMRGCVERMVQVLQEECDEMATYDRVRRESISRARGIGGVSGGGIGVSNGGGDAVHHPRPWAAGDGRESRRGWGERGEGERFVDEDAQRERDWRLERRRLRERAQQRKERDNGTRKKASTDNEHTHERKRKMCD